MRACWCRVIQTVLIVSICVAGSAVHARQIDGRMLTGQAVHAIRKLGFAALLQGPVSGPVNYVYDELGRLVAAIDAAGNVAVYSYDAVGNILSIRRYASTDLAIISFTPKIGPVGTTVTIYGTGFSTTANLNSVQFNGTSANVVSSTANQIVTTVPAGATSGAITVTTALGSITSSDSFTVSASSGAPQIASFTPQILAPGGSVVISGSNFDLAPQNDELILNVTHAVLPSSVTSGSMTMTVPSAAGSGHISLGTPAGTAVSAGDLFVPPAPFSPSQVGYTGRTNFGVATLASIATANKIGLLLFEGTAGHTVSIASSAATFSSCTFQIYKPDNTALSTSSASCASSSFLDSQRLPVTGSYALLINASAGSAGNATFTIYDSTEIAATLTAGGPPFTITTTVPGQNARLNFFGNQNQHVSLTLSGSTFANCSIYVYNPDSSSLVGLTSCTASTAFIEVPYLPERGVYTILVDPGSTQTGTLTVKLNDATDLTGAVTAGGSAATANITVPGQNAIYTFSGTTGQHVSISVSNTTIVQCDFELYNPDGTTLVASGNSTCSTSGFPFYDVPQLPQNGQYRLVVDPSAARTGTTTFTLNDATDVTGPITTDGTPITATTTVPGQRVRLTFSGSAGQVVAAVFDNNTISTGSTMSILGPTGATVWSVNSNPHTNAFLDPSLWDSSGFSIWPVGDRTLPSNGTYTLQIDPNDVGVGSIRTRLYTVPADQSSTGTLGGAAIPVSITTPGQNARITFSGTQNHKLSINLTGGTLSGTVSSGCTLTTLAPGGSLFAGRNDCYSASNFFDLGVLPSTGTYTVVIDAAGNTTGNTNVQLYDDTDVNLSIAADGTSNTVTTTVPGQNAYLNFSGTSGQRIFAVIDNLSGYSGFSSTSVILQRGASHSNLVLATQDGAAFDLCGSNCGVYVLPATDSYDVFLDPNGTDIGSARVTLYTVPADFSGTIDTAGDPVTVATVPGQNAQVTFSATSGQSLTVNLASGTYAAGSCLLSIKYPDGSLLANSRDCSGSSQTIGPFSLAATGTYTIIIDPQKGATGSVALSATAH